ncbi:hypothetical protein [Bacteroides fragilis]|uniref:hypothetical protein n=1 Tax=Bacteroides fragilis TaxID=817 RepID=UPI0022AA560A|nr:hypothetical protein [Bacteroides fragilis]MCZ2661600.1 hypothetical protein [Bacteroides fragilis]
MEHIKKIINWIDSHILEISLPEHELHKVFNLSKSKLEKDFKRCMNEKILRYILAKKIKAMINLKQENPNMTNIDLMVKANYNYSERTLRNHFKQYKLKNNNSFIDDFDYNFFHNVSIFTEILVRFILFNKISKSKIEGYSVLITQNVKDTIFQFGSLFPIEDKHFYRAFLNIDDLSLSFMHLEIQKRGDEKYLYSPKKLSQYFSYLYTINEKLKKYINYSLLKTIKNWDEYIKSMMSVSFISSSYVLELHEMKSMPPLEINKKSKFIQATDSLMNDIKQNLLNRYKRTFLKLYGISYETLVQYRHFAEKNNYNGMENILLNINTLENSNVINLFLQITKCPYLDDSLIDGIESVFGADITPTLYKCSRNMLIYYIVEYRKQIEKLSEDEYEDFDFNKWLLQLIKKTGEK